MTDRNTGGPAFPLNVNHKWFEGMTLRDYFAGEALIICPLTIPADKASWCYAMADAMLKAREAK